MPDQLEDQPIVETISFEGGMNAKDHPTQLQNHDAYLINGDLRDRFLRRKRNGWNDPLGGTFTATGSGFLALTSPSVVYAFFNNTAFRLGTEQTGLTATLAPTGTVVALSRVYRLSSTENIFSASTADATFTDEGSGNTSFPRCIKAIYTSTGRMLALDSTNGLYYSNALAPQTWDRTVQKLTLTSPLDGSNVDMIEYRPGLVVIARQDALMQLDISNPNPSFWTLRVLVPEIRFLTASRHSLDMAFGQLFVITKSGLFTLQQLLSSPSPRALSYELNLVLSTTGRYDIFCMNNRLWLYSDQTLKTYGSFTIRAFEYDIETNRWTALAGAANTVWGSTVTDMISFANIPYALTTGQQILRDALTDITYDETTILGAAAITYLFETRAFLGGDITIKKTGLMLEVAYLGDAAVTPTVEYMIDESGTWVALTSGVSSLTGTSGQIYKMKIPLLSLEYYSIRFRWQTVDVSQEVGVTSKIISLSVFHSPQNVEWGG